MTNFARLAERAGKNKSRVSFIHKNEVEETT